MSKTGTGALWEGLSPLETVLLAAGADAVRNTNNGWAPDFLDQGVFKAATDQTLGPQAAQTYEHLVGWDRFEAIRGDIVRCLRAQREREVGANRKQAVAIKTLGDLAALGHEGMVDAEQPTTLIGRMDEELSRPGRHEFDTARGAEVLSLLATMAYRGLVARHQQQETV